MSNSTVVSDITELKNALEPDGVSKWLSATAFASRVGINRVTASKVLQSAFTNKATWRGASLLVRNTTIYKGRAIYEVHVDSIPDDFRQPAETTNQESFPPKLVYSTEEIKHAIPSSPLFSPEVVFVDFLTLKMDFSHLIGSDFTAYHGGYVLDVLPDGKAILFERIAYDDPVLEGFDNPDNFDAYYSDISKSTFTNKRPLHLCEGSVKVATPKFAALEAPLYEGSATTKCLIRFVGGELVFIGNPSRWARPDNIWGYSLSECVEIINTVILPAAGFPHYIQFMEGQEIDVKKQRLMNPQNFRVKSTGNRENDMKSAGDAFKAAISAHEHYLKNNENIIESKTYKGYLACTMEYKRRENSTVSDMPHFTKDSILYVWTERIYTGAVISRIDLTTNFRLGSVDNVATWLSYAGSVTLGRMMPRVNPTYPMVSWQATGERHKIYCKYSEFKANHKKIIDTQYYASTLEHLSRLGLLRLESQYSRQSLSDYGYQYLGVLLQSRKWASLVALMQNRFSRVVRQQLISPDTTNLSRPEELVYRRWFEGLDCRSGISRQTFSRHSRGIFEKMGVDVRVPRMESANCPVPSIRVITCQTALPWEGYYRPSVPLLASNDN